MYERKVSFTILLVDPSPKDASVILDELRLFGYEIFYEQNAFKAFHRLLLSRPRLDLVLTKIDRSSNIFRNALYKSVKDIYFLRNTSFLFYDDGIPVNQFIYYANDDDQPYEVLSRPIDAFVLFKYIIKQVNLFKIRRKAKINPENSDTFPNQISPFLYI